MSGRKRQSEPAPAKLATVVPFRPTVFSDGVSASWMPYREARAEWHRLCSRGAKPSASEWVTIRKLTDAALPEVLREKVTFERGLGGRIPINPQSALFQNALAVRLGTLREIHDWLEEHRGRAHTESAVVIDLATFRRFRARVGRGAS